MKRKLRKLFSELLSLATIGCLLAFVWPTLVSISGCTAPQQRIAVNTLYSTHTTVDGAFLSYMALALAGKVPTNGVPAAAQAYRDFQAVYNAAVETVANNTNAAAPPTVTAAASKLLSLTR